jgi:1-acyl-sn-glycerol-3-phosphate acyltransferase
VSVGDPARLVSRSRNAALTRKLLWRLVLTVTGGLSVGGIERLPLGPCVIVANHNSHADTAALIAALPASRRPAVAAAADYWFDSAAAGGLRGLLSGRRVRATACRVLCGAFPVRRGGGGSADLAAAARLLAQGRDVIVYPEGSRSRDGHVGQFRRGAARLAILADVPVVPVGITGTRALLPATRAASAARHRIRALPRRGAVKVCIGTPIRARTVTPDGAPSSVAPSDVAALDRVASDAAASVTFLAWSQVTALITG